MDVRTHLEAPVVGGVHLPLRVDEERDVFDATFNNGSVNRYATSSIVAGAALPALAIAFGAPARITPSRSRFLLRAGPFR